MNFHKTIGYLAALLLMVGFGVPDSFAQSVEISVAPNTATESAVLAAETVTVTVTATVRNLTTDQEATVTHYRDVAVTVSPGDDSYSVSPTTLTLRVRIPPSQATGDTTGTMVFTINTDPDTDPETLTFTGKSADLVDADENALESEATFTINDTNVNLPDVDNAVDASGIRVLVVSPGNGEYASVGDRKVKVQVLRKDGLASEWGNYTGLAVSLFNRNEKGNGDDPEEAIHDLILDDTGGQLGTLAITTLKRDTLETTDASDGGRVTYRRRTRDRGYDTLQFEFDIAEGEGGDLGKVYARATFTGPNVAADNDSLNSFDTSKSIYPENPSAFPEKVGDGNFVKIDRSIPSESVFGALTVKIVDKNKIGGTENAGIGDQIQITGSVNGVFRDHSVELVIISPQVIGYTDADVLVTRDTSDDGEAAAELSSAEGDTVVAANSELVGYSTTIPATKIFDDGGSISAKFIVAANQFKRTYTADGAAGSDIKKGATFEDDNIKARVQVKVKDKAGNAIAQEELSGTFTLDSKPPKVTLSYPDSSHHRFTTSNAADYTFLGDSNVSLELKALNFKVDEAHDGGYIFVGGGAVATNDTLAFTAANAPSGDDVDLSKLEKNPKSSNGKANKKAPHEEAPYNAGKAVTLKIVAMDNSGNSGSATPVAGTSGAAGTAIYDNLAPKITNLFPNNADLGKTAAGQKIGGDSQHPVFRINEVTDSILVRYQADDGTKLDIAGTIAQEATKNQNIRVKFLGDNALVPDEVYNLQVYARDLAGQVGLSKQAADGLTFDNGLSNPVAGGFQITSMVDTGTGVTEGDEAEPVARDSVVASQRMVLKITAHDTMMTRVLNKKDQVRPAITYAIATTIVAMDANGNKLSSVSFSGAGKSVTDNGDGSAALNADGWAAGTRSVNIESDKAIGPFSIVVKDMTADGVVNFSDAKEGLVVGAADIAGFELTAWEVGVDGATTEVWEGFTLRIVPVDAYGNSASRAFIGEDYTTDTEPTHADSLKLLGDRYKEDDSNVTDYDAGAGIDIQLQSFPAVGLPQEVWGLTTDGSNIAATAPASGSLTIQARVVNSSLVSGDTRTFNLKEQLILTVQQPLDLSITLWVLGEEGDQAGNTVTTPAGESIDVTARAEGLNEGDMVTFTIDGEAQDAVAADADGYAGQPIELSGSGTVSVTASSGQYSASLDVVYEEAPAEEGRKAYVDSNGDPVYLIAKESGMVGVDDFLALVAAFGSSEGDDNYNVQADVNDDGSVGVDDFLVFVGSFGKTAAVSGKPIVLLPGINENAEFSLSLGSDRVVAGELVAVDVSLANVEALIGYGFALNYDADKFEFISVASADEDLLTSTGGETLFHHVVADGQISVATGMYNGTAVSGGGDIVRFVFRVLYEFEDNARFEIADGLVFDPSQLQNPAVVAGVLELQSTPREFALHQNFPNPFNPDTTIKYDLAESADVTLQIYNVLGQVVRTLVASEAQNAGRYQIRWNGMDDRGVSVSSGIYFYRISAGEFQNVRKLMLLK